MQPSIRDNRFDDSLEIELDLLAAAHQPGQHSDKRQ
jgi:hypothetical protein